MERKEGRKLVRRVEVKVEEGGVELVGGRGKWGGRGEREERKGERWKSEGEGGENGGERKKEEGGKRWRKEEGRMGGMRKWRGVRLREEEKGEYVGGKGVKVEKVREKEGLDGRMYMKLKGEKGGG